MQDSNQKFTQEVDFRKEGEQLYISDQDSIKQSNDLLAETTKHYNDTMEQHVNNGASKQEMAQS